MLKAIGIVLLVLFLIGSGLWIVAFPAWLWHLHREDVKHKPRVGYNEPMAAPYDPTLDFIAAGVIGYHLGHHGDQHHYNAGPATSGHHRASHDWDDGDRW